MSDKGKFAIVFLLIFFFNGILLSQENITRGLVAVKTSEGIFVSWRWLGNESNDTYFNVYRIVNEGVAEKLNEEPLTSATNFFDASAELSFSNQYYVTPLVNEIEQDPSEIVGTWEENYLSIPLQIPDGGTAPDGSYSYSANDASLGDLDGDGEYEIILKWDPNNAKDNSQSGYTGNVILDAYELDGTLLWRIDLGINVRAGAHYTQFMVWDLNGDGKAEVSLRTAPGSKDASGEYLNMGPAGSVDHNLDLRNTSGYILQGEEFLTVFNGEDGTEKFTTTFEPDRGNVTDWGDDYGNRVDRFLGGIAYLDGENPSLFFGRGIYTKVEIAAYTWEDDGLVQSWIFKSQEGFDDWSGMGSHNLSVGDIDQDGFDEILYGNCAIDHDGTGLWSLRNATGQGTGDAMHLADIIPERPGLEKFGIGEGTGSAGSHLVDAKTGEALWITGNADIGRGVSADLSPDYFGMECWGGTNGLRSGYNAMVGESPSSTNHVVWWDGDLSRELLDGTTISKYGEGVIFSASGCSSNNGSKSNPCLQADLLGDWREEVIWRTSDNAFLRIYTTTNLTEYRIKTLMHDHMYRLAIAWQNNSYNQPPHTSFYLGSDMFTPVEEIPPARPTGLDITIGTETLELNWPENGEPDLVGYDIHRSEAGGDFIKLNDSPQPDVGFVDVDVDVDVEYRYFIKAVDDLGNLSISSDTIAGIPTLRPNPPSDVKGRSGFSECFIFWNSVSEAIGYNIFMSTASDGSFEKLNNDLITTTNYLFKNVENGKSRYFFITAVDNVNLESFPSEVVIVPAGEETIIQAEDADLFSGVSFDSNNEGFNGSGFANFESSGYVEFKHIYARTEGKYEFEIRYSLGNSARTGTIKVNESEINYTMNDTGGWTNYVTDIIEIDLEEGYENTIRFSATGSDFGNLDEIKVGEEIEVINNPLGLIETDNELIIYPNPFSSYVIITLKNASSTPQFEIVNLTGKQIFSAFLERKAHNEFEFRWNGTNRKGQKLPLGIYFIRVKSGDNIIVRKISILN